MSQTDKWTRVPRSPAAADEVDAAVASSCEVRVFLSVMSLNGATSLRIGVVYPVVMWSVVQLAGNASHAGQLLFWCLLANLFWTPLAGKLLGAVRHKKHILAGALFAAGLVGLLPLVLSAAGKAPDFVILASAMLGNFLMAFLVAGAADYFMKTYVREQVRLARLSLIGASNFLLQMGSSLLSGFLLLHLPAEQVLLLLTLYSWGPLLLVWRMLPDLAIAPPVADKENGVRRWHTWREMLPLWPLTAYRRAPLLLVFAAGPALCTFLAYGMDALLPALIQFRLQLSSAHFAMGESAWAAGGMVASLLMARFGARLPVSYRFDIGLAGAGAVLLCLMPHLPFFGLVTVIFGMGVMGAGLTVRAQAAYLKHCPQSLLGRYRSAGIALASLGGLAAVSMPGLLAHWRLDFTYALLGGVCLVALVGWWWLEAHLRKARADGDAGTVDRPGKVLGVDHPG